MRNPIRTTILAATACAAVAGLSLSAPAAQAAKPVPPAATGAVNTLQYAHTMDLPAGSDAGGPAVVAWDVGAYLTSVGVDWANPAVSERVWTTVTSSTAPGGSITMTTSGMRLDGSLTAARGRSVSVTGTNSSIDGTATLVVHLQVSTTPNGETIAP